MKGECAQDQSRIQADKWEKNQMDWMNIMDAASAGWNRGKRRKREREAVSSYRYRLYGYQGKKALMKIQKADPHPIR
jgi:hypothetical protein